MTDYAGESYEVYSSATMFDGITPLTPSNVDEVIIHIQNPDGTFLVTAQTMTWNSTEQIWIYAWDTSVLAAGTYKARVAYISGSSTISFEFINLRLHTPKFVV